MDQPKRILVVEDDRHIADLICLHLRDEHFEVVHSADGDEGLRLLEQGGWDALILDLMLPGVDGLEICRRARSMARYTPIIITSARSSEVHRILGLELGADDYLAKPFSVLELVARVRALLRSTEALARNARMESGRLDLGNLTSELGPDDYLAKPFSVLELVARVRALLRRTEALARNARMESGRLDLGNLGIHPVAREVQVDGKPIELTPREFDLLYFFARHPGRVFSRLDLLNQVWGYQHDGYEHTV